MATTYKRRYNLVYGTLGAALTSSGTAITFAAALKEGGAGGTNIATLATDEYVVLRIDDELVYLSAYTSGATSGTIVRAQEGTTGAAHASGAVFRLVPSKLDDNNAIQQLAVVSLAADTANNATWTPFSNIPQTFRHLRLILEPIRITAQSGAAEVVYCRLNGSSSANYGQDGGLITANWNVTFMPVARCDDLDVIITDMHLWNYTAASTLKIVSYVVSGSDGTSTLYNNRGTSWLGSSSPPNGITSIGFGLYDNSNAFKAGSRATLYGIM